jgi:hypothetical protein
MGITISGASTQIPTNVVEVGNEITQNQLNAITASASPAVGNPFITNNALGAYVNANVFPSINQRAVTPPYAWGHPFPTSGNFVAVYNAGTNTWWPWNSAGTVIHQVFQGNVTNSYNFDFNDYYGMPYSLNSSDAVVGSSTLVYTTLGQWLNGTTWQSNTTTTGLPASGPTYASNWDNPVSVSNQFYDGSNYVYRYVYLNGNGGFYTADNQNNPPY